MSEAIIGIGTDIVQTSRIKAILTNKGERFAEKILGPDELIEYRKRSSKVPERGLHYLCTRFAAKEAFSKALGTGMRLPVTWRTVQVLNADNGAPCVVTSGALDDYMTANGYTAMASVSDEVAYSVALILIKKP